MLNYNRDNKTRLPLEHYMKRFSEADVREIAERIGVIYNTRFELNILGETLYVTWPDFSDEGWNDTFRILFLRYLLEGVKAPAYTDFVTYRDMPWGEVYDVNFQGRCVKKLARVFGNNIEAFKRSCSATGGVIILSSGTGYQLCFLPGLFVRFIIWEGDSEFQPNAQILFSDNFAEVFSAEDRVVVCEYIIDKLRKTASKV